jgi:serine/threonine protein kinase
MCKNISGAAPAKLGARALWHVFPPSEHRVRVTTPQYLRQKRSINTDRNAQKQCRRTFFRCLSKALEYLHKSRILHKDIKPQDVLMKREDAYLTDFTTAKTLGEMIRGFLTGRTDEVTPRYCAPEVADQAVSSCSR